MLNSSSIHPGFWLRSSRRSDCCGLSQGRAHHAAASLPAFPHLASRRLGAIPSTILQVPFSGMLRFCPYSDSSPPSAEHLASIWVPASSPAGQQDCRLLDNFLCVVKEVVGRQQQNDRGPVSVSKLPTTRASVAASRSVANTTSCCRALQTLHFGSIGESPHGAAPTCSLPLVCCR